MSNFLVQAEMAFVQDFRESFFHGVVEGAEQPDFSKANTFFSRWSGYMFMHSSCLSRQETDPLIIYGIAAATVKMIIKRSGSPTKKERSA